MTDPTGPKPARNLNSPSSSNGPKFPNPPESVNPDAATIRDQWRFAIRQYSKWYAHAWGTAILAGVSFFALGWVIKGENPLNSLKYSDSDDNQENNSTAGDAEGNRSG